MKRLAAVAAVMLAAPATALAQEHDTRAAASRLDAEASVGAGWDDNLNNASLAADQAGGGFGLASARLGWMLPVPLGGRFIPALRYAHTEYPDYPDLSSDAVGATPALFVPVRLRAMVGVVPRAQMRFYPDTRRNATDVGGTASVRVLLGTRASARVSGSYLDSTAKDPVFSRWSYGGAGGLELRLPGDVFLGGEYAWDRGTDYSYVAASAVPAMAMTGAGSGSGSGQGGPGHRTGGGTSMFGGDQIAVKGEATMQRLFVDADRAFGPHLVVRAGFVHTEVDGDFGSYRANGINGALAWRF